MTATIDAPSVPGPRRPSYAPAVVRQLPPLEPCTGPIHDREPPPAAPEPPKVPGDPRAEVGTVLRLVMEMLDGRRPSTQLGGRLSPLALRYLVAAKTRLNPPATRRAVARGRHGPPGLRSLRMSHPAERVTEASAVWRHRGRYRALAARFEWEGGRWRCTVLRLG